MGQLHLLALYCWLLLALFALHRLNALKFHPRDQGRLAPFVLPNHAVKGHLALHLAAIKSHCLWYGEKVNTLNDKLVRRHPHVFAEQSELTDAELSAQWQAIKAQERAEKAASPQMSLWQDIPDAMPGLSKAKKIQQRVASLGFDWPSYHGALDKVAEEVDEVKEALAHDPYSEHSAEELGDLLFATVNVARHIKRDPEQLLRSANAKFASRFEKVAAYLDECGQSLETASLEEMDSAWEAIKKQSN